MRNFNKHLLKEAKLRRAENLISKDYIRWDWNANNCREKEILREFGISQHEYFRHTYGNNYKAPKHFRKFLNRTERYKSKSHMKKITSSFKGEIDTFMCECNEEPFYCYDTCCSKFDSLLDDSSIANYKGADWLWW